MTRKTNVERCEEYVAELEDLLRRVERANRAHWCCICGAHVELTPDGWEDEVEHKPDCELMAALEGVGNGDDKDT